MLPALESVQALITFLEESIPSPLRRTDLLSRTLERGEHARRGIRELDEKRLVLGFLGGTGVGKSTLLNAIAGNSISQSGTRRPTTDRIVCYRHSEFAVPNFLSDDDLSTPPAPHDIDTLRGVTILDLPDIDSHQSAHRDRVHRVLPHLDLLVVVTSIDKYADRLLYDELRLLPQAPENAVVVLNAIDRLRANELPAVLEDFAEKLDAHAGWPGRSIMPMSAKLAGEANETSGDRHGLTPLLALMEELGGDARRRAVLSANAKSHLDRFTSGLDESLPPADLEAWITQLEALALRAPQPSGSLLATFAHDLEEEIGPWMSDRALRASSFPIGWMHFLFRRFRRGRNRGRIRDPFRAGHDPSRAYAEEILERPLRLAAHEAGECLRHQSSRVTLDLPPVDSLDAANSANALNRWQERLRKKAPKLGWKVRHHLLPVAGLLATLAWVAAPAMRARDSWLSATWDNVWATIERLSPMQWGIVAASLLVYYLLTYPYLLYRIERRIEDEAERGVKRYLEHFAAEYQRAWAAPLATRVSGVRAWWREYLTRRNAISPR